MTSALAAQPATPSDSWDHTHPPASDGPQVPWAGQGVHGGQWAPAGEPAPTVTSHPQCCEAIYSSVSGLKAHLASCSKVSAQALPSAVCSVLPAAPQGPIHPVCPPGPLGFRASTAQDCPPSLSPAVSQSVVVGPAYGLFICVDTGGWSTQAWGWHPRQWAVTLPWSTCLLPPSLCSAAARAPWWSCHSSLVGL